MPLMRGLHTGVVRPVWCVACYAPQHISIEPMSANGLESIKRTSTFSNKGGDEMWWWNVRVSLTVIPRMFT